MDIGNLFKTRIMIPFIKKAKALYFLSKVRDDLNNIFQRSNISCFFRAEEYRVNEDKLYFIIEARFTPDTYFYIRDFVDFVEVKISSNGIANYTIKYNLF